jgi:hypothetical protein
MLSDALCLLCLGVISVNQLNQLTTVERIRKEYGELICLKELAYIFRYPSVDAVRKSIQRKTFPVPGSKLPNRATLYASAQDVADCLDNFNKEETAND